MSTFVMFGKYSSEALKKISTERTDKAENVIKQHGGEVKSIYALLGGHDLVLIIDIPSIEQAMKVSVALFKLTGVSFTTSPALEIKEFDKLMSEV